MSKRIVRAAMTQTVNAYKPMPATVDELSTLEGKLDEIREANLDHHEELIAAAAAEGAKVIGLGELFPAPYFALGKVDFWRQAAEDAQTGPSILRMKKVAAEHNIVIVAPIYELDATTGKRFNTAVVIDSDGSVLGSYRKSHIPCGGNETGEFSETHYYGPSEGNPGGWFPVFETSVGKIGVAICYDRHFEGVMAALKRGGAELVFSPAITFGAKSRRVWDLEFPTDASRHRLFIGGSNRGGAEQPWNIEFFGASYFVGPDGNAPNLSDDEELIIADLDLGSLEDPDTSGWDIARDARPEIYG